MRLPSHGLCLVLTANALVVAGCIFDFGALSREWGESSSGGGSGSTTTGSSSASSSSGGPEKPCCPNEICVEGRCPVVLIADHGAVPSSIGLYLRRVCWSDSGTKPNDGSIQCQEAAGGSALPPLASGLDHPSNVVVRDKHLYFTMRHDGDAGTATLSVERISLESNVREPVATSSGAPHGLAVDDQFVFWAAYQGAGTKIFKAPRTGGGPVTELIDDKFYSLTSVAVDEDQIDGGRVYWLQDSQDGGIQSINKASTSNIAFNEVSGVSRPSGLLVKQGSLFWGTYGGGDSVSVKPLVDGGAITEIAGGQHSVAAFALAGDTLFWVTIANGNADGTLVRYDLSKGGPADVIVGSLSRPTSVVADQDAVYWTTENDGRVRKLETCACNH